MGEEAQSTIYACGLEAIGLGPDSGFGSDDLTDSADPADFTFTPGQLLYLPVKRSLDVLFGLAGCAFAAQAALIIKVAYMLGGDTHPIVYSQRRVGLRGKQFDMLKFRSMVWGADEALEELLEDPAMREQWDRERKLERDPRITVVGKLLRRTSLDELPQFINLVKGDMSIVGPRPLVPGELEAHRGSALYNKVKPGITGWWACNGRSNVGYPERLELEYRYARRFSPRLDALCVLRTVMAVLKGEGAR